MITHRAFRCLYLYAAAALLVSGVLVAPVRAQIAVAGQVYPSDNPFTADLEGLYGFVNTFLPETDTQVGWERDRNVTIGEGAFGSVRLSQAGFLNFQHIVLGGSENEVDPSSPRVGPGDGVIENGIDPLSPVSGYGVLRIEDFQTFYNNHPKVIPSQYQDIYDTNNPEQTLFPTENTRPDSVGFDAYIGLTGSGELYIAAGGRAEIQDAVIVGFAPDSTGHVEVTGLGSYLAAYGGLNPNATVINRDEFDNNEIHQMIIGAYGDGSMTISDGGHVDAFYGAAIGVTRSDGSDELTDQAFDNSLRDLQGSGRVIVDGDGSLWNIMITAFEDDELPQGMRTEGGALAIGEFNDALNPQYISEELGRGYLSVRNNGLVRVHRYTDENNPTTDHDADLRIGRLGTLDFRGGRVTVQDQLVNDGVIQATHDGTGIEGGHSASDNVLEVATFENRLLGQVRVGAGQSLRVLATINATDLAPDAPEMLVGGNHGVIEVIGDQVSGRADFEYIHEYDTSLDAAIFASLAIRDPHVFYNAGEITDPGKIVAHEANLRFRTGLWNAGEVAFTGGDNLVTGRVMNAWDATNSEPGGAISISNGSYVTFEDTVTNDGTITLSDNSGAMFLGGLDDGTTTRPAYSGVGDLNIVSTGDVHVAGDFFLGDPDSLAPLGGTLRLYVEDFTVDGYSHLVVEGDGDFSAGGIATIEILGNAMGPLTVGDAIDLITVLGTANFTGTTIQSLVATAPGTVLVTDTSGPALTLIVASAIGALAGDFNGDGVVDAADYTVWRDNLGGDDAIFFGNSNNDGVIDAADYAIWTGNYGSVLAAPAPSAGLGVVPEPAALTLLGSLALFGGRRRRG
ncbi:hypothetical protein KOR34_40670 [Posidoniimonas corsicana]|uniref:PEP-CTERM protein-sorting domain-containing protein n=1 Tax=Posidoniimonas corsicana TaxID=1938618 RepID=A0A5C5V3P3_9BACT|nr:hypothetical protein [Posidoniimonas corsicana]TWT32305.1 hypothetical protein KOR34_40670 [Posidoniimonas corsicana]